MGRGGGNERYGMKSGDQAGVGFPVQRARPAVPKRRPPRRPARPAPTPPVLAGSSGDDDVEVTDAPAIVEAVPGANSYSDESAFLTRVAEVDGLSVAQLACSLERAGVYCGAGVTKEAMRCALKANMTGRADNATAAEVFDEFAEGGQELGKQQLSMVCATLGNLLDEDGLDDLFEELDVDGDGSVSRGEFMVWWDAEVAPNQEINRRAAALERFKAEAAGALFCAAEVHRATVTRASVYFAAGWGEAELSVAEVFRRLDRDGSGTLDLSEVERLAAALGVILSRTSAQDMFAQVGSQPEWNRWIIR